MFVEPPNSTLLYVIFTVSRRLWFQQRKVLHTIGLCTRKNGLQATVWFKIVPSPASEPVKNTGKVDGIKAKAVPRVSQFYYYNSKGVPIVLLQFMIMRLPVRMRQRILHVVTLCAFCSVFGV